MITLLEDAGEQLDIDARKTRAKGSPSAHESPTAASPLTITLLKDAGKQLDIDTRKTRARGRLSTIVVVVAGIVVIVAGILAGLTATSFMNQNIGRGIIFIGATVLVGALGAAVGFFLSLVRKRGEKTVIQKLSETLFEELSEQRQSAERAAQHREVESRDA